MFRLVLLFAVVVSFSLWMVPSAEAGHGYYGPAVAGHGSVTKIRTFKVPFFYKKTVTRHRGYARPMPVIRAAVMAPPVAMAVMPPPVAMAVMPPPVVVIAPRPVGRLVFEPFVTIPQAEYNALRQQQVEPPTLMPVPPTQ